MKTELELLLEEFKEKRHRCPTFSYLCNVSPKFEELWKEDRTKIREKAALFLKEIDNDMYSLGFVKDGWNEVLFIGGNSHIVRVNFLKWCIEKGYETINDLFI